MQRHATWMVLNLAVKWNPTNKQMFLLAKNNWFDTLFFFVARMRKPLIIYSAVVLPLLTDLQSKITGTCITKCKAWTFLKTWSCLVLQRMNTVTMIWFVQTLNTKYSQNVTCVCKNILLLNTYYLTVLLPQSYFRKMDMT